MDNNLNESFSMLPIGLHKVGQMDDISIYSNDRIKDIIKEQSYNNPSSRYIYKTIENGLKNDKIMVGYSTQSFTSHIFRRFKEWNTHRSKKTSFGRVLQSFKSDDIDIIGQSDKLTMSVAVILDKNIDILGDEIYDETITTIIHELCHLSCSNDTNKFFNATKTRFLIPFYRAFFKNIMNKEIDEHILEETVSNIMIISESYFSVNDPHFVMKIRQQWYNFFKQHEYDNKQANILSLSIMFPFLHLVAEQSLSTNEMEIMKKVIICLYKAYKEIGYSDIKEYTVVCQEVVFPSEIVAITNQFSLSSQLVNVINSLKF